jgi:hypothetical protein
MEGFAPHFPSAYATIDPRTVRTTPDQMTNGTGTPHSSLAAKTNGFALTGQ